MGPRSGEHYRKGVILPLFFIMDMATDGGLQDDKLTTYTVFCPPQTPPACDIGLEFPFVFAEGPSTLQFHGTVHSTL